MPGQLKIGADWVAGEGELCFSPSLADDNRVWEGRWSSRQQIDAAISAAHASFNNWSESSLQSRMNVCRRFAEGVSQKRHALSLLIARETGKPLWEADTEVSTVIGKVANSIDAVLSRRWTTTEKVGEMLAVTRYRPHGAMLVLGPYNLPAHLPGSHIVPALLAGNTLVFKPSELTPGCGQWLVQAWEQAGLPAGVLNLIQGGAEVAQAAAGDERLAGILFTGSRRAGESLHRACAGRPERVLALEMGGNNPLVIHRPSDRDLAVIAVIQSAFITSGQRCTCARRLLITEQSRPEQFLTRLVELTDKIRVKLPLDDPQPFMGPLIRTQHADRLLATQERLLSAGGVSLLPMRRLAAGPSLLSPGLIETTGLKLEDEEHFGPLLCVERGENLDDAIQRANQTRYGLAAGLICDRVEDFHYFLHHVRAGVVNWNRQTTGASGRLPFGGVGGSGNHRPSGFFAADYCSYPMASLESHDLSESRKPMPGLEDVAHACSLK